MAGLHRLFVWKLAAAGLFGDASFEGALDGVAGEIEGTVEVTEVEESLRFLQTDFREFLEFLAVHKGYGSGTWRMLLDNMVVEDWS